jgi:hypothetical protein
VARKEIFSSGFVIRGVDFLGSTTREFASLLSLSVSWVRSPQDLPPNSPAAQAKGLDAQSSTKVDEQPSEDRSVEQIRKKQRMGIGDGWNWLVIMSSGELWSLVAFILLSSITRELVR